jgi:hypothetical protein
MVTVRTLFLTLLLSFAGPATATTLSWVHAGNGNASTASNWSPAQVPAAGDILVFNLAGSRTVTWDSSVPSSTQHVYRAGTNSLSFSAPHVVSGNVLLGTQAGDTANVNVIAGTLIAGGTSTIGSAAGSKGLMTVAGSNVLFQVQNTGADIIVGGSGRGTLVANGGGIVRANDDLILGNAAGSLGSCSVSGSSALNSSTLEVATADADIVVGNAGNGSLIVSSTGVVNVADDMAIGVGAAVNGQVLVSDAKSIITVNDLCSVANNTTAGVGTGIGSLTLSAGSTMIVKDSLRVGDPDGGTGTLIMNGGFLHVKNFALDGVHGAVTWNGGTFRVDGGAGTAGKGITMGTSTSASSLEVIRGANVTVNGNLFFSGTGSNAASILVDSGAHLSTIGTNDLIATNGTFTVTVDSASTLGGGDMQFGGSSSNTTLLVTNGSSILVSSFESADEPGAVSTINLNGTSSSIHWDNVFYLAGDGGHAGGTADMTIANGGLLKGDVATSAIQIWNGGTMHVNTGGAISALGVMKALGVLDMGGGTVTMATTSLQGTGRIRGHGTVTAGVVSSDPTTRISAVGGNLTLGKAAAGGFAFAGTLEASAFLTTLVSSSAITLGDTTTSDEGRIKSAAALTNPATGYVGASGAFETPTFTNQGVLAIGGPTPDTLRIQGALSLGATSTVRMRIRGATQNLVDRITVTGNATLGGALELAFDSHGVYPSNTTVTLMTFPSRTNVFSQVIVSGLDPSRFQVVTTAAAIQVTFLGTVGVGDELPKSIAFSGRSGAFELALPRAAQVHVALYDVRGREVARLVDGAKPAGIHRLVLPDGVRRGIYFGRARIREDGADEDIVRTDRVLVTARR